jgi:hypothetical protein
MERVGDSWRDVLVDMDEQLHTYAQHKCMVDGGTVADDLVTLLVLGTASAELEQFLCHTLGDKTLTRVHHQVAGGYARLQQLLECNVRRACEVLVDVVHAMRVMYDARTGELVRAACRRVADECAQTLLKVWGVCPA